MGIMMSRRRIKAAKAKKLAEKPQEAKKPVEKPKKVEHGSNKQGKA